MVRAATVMRRRRPPSLAERIELEDIRQALERVDTDEVELVNVLGRWITRWVLRARGG